MWSVASGRNWIREPRGRTLSLGVGCSVESVNGDRPRPVAWELLHNCFLDDAISSDVPAAAAIPAVSLWRRGAPISARRPRTQGAAEVPPIPTDVDTRSGTPVDRLQRPHSGTGTDLLNLRDRNRAGTRLPRSPGAEHIRTVACSTICSLSSDSRRVRPEVDPQNAT